MSTIRFVSRVIASAALCLFSGCFELYKDPLEPRTYRFDIELPPMQVAAIVQRPVLLVADVSAPAPYNRRAFVYRTGENEFVADHLHGFLTSPAAQLTEVARSWLRAAGAFPQVVDPDSSLTHDFVLELTLVELFADYQATPPQARVHVRAVLIDLGAPPPEAAAGAAERQRFAVKLQKDYEQTVPLPVLDASADTDPAAAAAAAEALVAAWEQGIVAILTELTTALRPFGAAAAAASK